MMRGYCRRLSRKRAPQPEQAQLRHYSALYAGLCGIGASGTWRDHIAACTARAKAVSVREFCFLQHRVCFADQVAWQAPEASRLWRYHLHYFDYLTDVLVWAATEDRANAYRTFRDLALSWIEFNDVIAGDGWHPYTISLRVVNWLNAVSFFAAELQAENDARERILRSLYGQLEFLFSNLELDVRGNHLIENLRALICGGVAFEKTLPWRVRAEQRLELEIKEQILSDGGHFERCPGYHLIVLRDLLEIAIWLRRNEGASPPWLEAAVHKMAGYLFKVLPPNRQVPLLKDSTWDGPFTADEVLAACAAFLEAPELKSADDAGFYAALVLDPDQLDKIRTWPVTRGPESIALPDSGHYVIRDNTLGDFLIFDAGKPCPDYLPAHAHADLLTYELCVANERVIVDSGVYRYAAGDWRNYFRSTRAHNTVEVAGQNQSEVWDSFRVGRRARPGRVHWWTTDQTVLVQAEHDGYRRLRPPVIHQRTILSISGKFWLFVDQLWGDNTTTARNHVHLQPGLSFKPNGAGAWKIAGAAVPLSLTAYGPCVPSIVEGQKDHLRQGWYSERFGALQTNSVLTFDWKGTLPVCFGYVIGRGGLPAADVSVVPNGNDIMLSHEGDCYQLTLIRDDPPRFK